ncbi:MAG: rod shape-determining protein [Atopostipes sp.]|nr:rod shape-determining protein [Atopostipes sp.]
MAKDIGIDLGTANVLVHVKNKGIVINEPAVVAIDKNTKEVVAVGEEAYLMVGRTPGNIEAIRPLKGGVIADFDITEAMLSHFIKKINVTSFLSKPSIIISTPTNITSIEQKAIIEVAEKAGGKTIYLEEEPKMAAVGAGMDIFQPTGNMVVDIGGGTTDVAVLSMGDIVTSESIKKAGDLLDHDIKEFVKKKHGLLIGERTAESIKQTIGEIFDEDREDTMDIRGRAMVSGLPETVEINSQETLEAMKETMKEIVAAVRNVLEKTPPELSADIIDRGIIVTGGGALLSGIDQLLVEELKVPVFKAEEPLDSVALGTAILLKNLEKLKK